MRAIAEELGISRGAVVGERWPGCRPSVTGRPRHRPSRARGSIIDAFEPILKELLAKYPNLTVERALARIACAWLTPAATRRSASAYGSCVRAPRRRRCRALRRAEGMQAQMDHGVYDIDFTREGRRRVYLFSYLLGYSRRQYLRLVESMDLLTTLREHVHAFHHLGGMARVCLYDNFKAVVLRHDADGPLYNPKFLAFATHYGFRPQACRVRRPQTKGKVERKFLMSKPICSTAAPSTRWSTQRSDGLVAAKRSRCAGLA